MTQESPYTENAVTAAKALVVLPSGSNEATIKQHLAELLSAMNIQSALEHPTGSGYIDLFCYRIRTVIEVKKRGRAGDPEKPQSGRDSKSPKQQIEEYIKSQIFRDQKEKRSRLVSEDVQRRGTLFPEGEDLNLSWNGILTDGKIWHLWQWENHMDSVARGMKFKFKPKNEKDLLDWLREVLDRKPVEKEWIPQNPKEILEEFSHRLEEIYGNLSGKVKKETDTKFNLWKDMLRASGMEPESDSKAHHLFVRHSFLVSVARNVVYILTSQNPENREEVQKILQDGFVSWISQDIDGEDWQIDLLEKINSYDWRRQKGDVLRSVYEGFISDTDRKIFGEYYTPDWLAQLLVNETLDPEWCREAISAVQNSESLEGIGVLDPACGSGTFLYHSVKKIIDSEAMQELHLTPQRQAEIATKLVNGIDVHPVAAEIARATLLRALPAPPPDGPKSINVWQGDSLMTFHADKDYPIFNWDTNDGFCSLKTPHGTIIKMPLSFCRNPEFSVNMDRMVRAAKNKSPIPKDIVSKIPEADRPALKECYKTFTEIIEIQGNSIWTWFVTNITAPLLLSEKKVNRIVANPPWVKMAHIQVEYRKNELERAFMANKLWSGGQQAPQNDIAQLFVKVCRETYLSDPGLDMASWIVKKSVLKSRQWKKFRTWYQPSGSGQQIGKQILDLEAPEPFGARGSRSPCALFDLRACTQSPELVKFQNDKLVLVNNKNQDEKPASFMHLEQVMPMLKFSIPSKEFPQKASFYRNSDWRNGATMYPNVLVILQEVKKDPGSHKNAVVTTELSRHGVWKRIKSQSGTVPKQWVKKLYKSANFLPFMLSENPTIALIPVAANGTLDTNPGTSCEFWNKLDRIYKKHKPRGKASGNTLLNCIDFHGKLSGQLDFERNAEKTLVIYPLSGSWMRACRVTVREFIADQSIIKCQFSSAHEAAYLTALLNAPCLQSAFVESQTTDRHFTTHIWSCIPITKFNPDNSNHVRLAGLTERAESEVSNWYQEKPEHSLWGQRKASNAIRKRLEESGIFAEIDKITRRLLPDHVEPEPEDLE